MDSVTDLWLFAIGVSPFGDLRVNIYFQLTAAFRRLSRPSSALGAKAFILCSFSLEQLRFVLFFKKTSSLFCLSFANNCFGLCNTCLHCFSPPEHCCSLWLIVVSHFSRKDLLSLKNLSRTTICFVSVFLFGFQ